MTTFKSLSDLSGRTALITGTAGGLGKVFSETLAELGCDLILVDLPGNSMDSLAKELKSNWNIKTKVFYCDLEKAGDRKTLINEVLQNYSQLNVLVNNAGFVGSSNLEGWNTSFENQSIETWRRAFEVNLTAPFELCQGFAALMKKSTGASIINIASIYGHLGPDWRLYEGIEMGNPAAYSSSKGALIQFTKWLSTTLAPDVRANTVCPGGVLRNQPKEFISRYQSKTPLGRMANEDDLRGVIGYLASDLSAYVTGQSISVDGGWSAW
jgi:NAD(P)-dependent dehydrogenase (short-subunit alcohol dehydrogenase family)